MAWKKMIESKINLLVKERLEVLQQQVAADGTYRPFVNSINVKLWSKDLSTSLMIIAARENVTIRKKKAEFVEQKFKITKETTFEDLKIAACDFWGLENLRFSLYDENFHDLMSLLGQD